MNRFCQTLLPVALLAAWPAATLAQQNLEAVCRNELAARFAGFEIVRWHTRENPFRGLIRAGNDTREFECYVNNDGSLWDMKVDVPGRLDPRVAGADSRGRMAESRRNEETREYQRGYADGYRRGPYNNYRNDETYERGYDAGNDDRRRRL